MAQHILGGAQIREFFHDEFVSDQVEHFSRLIDVPAGTLSDIGGGCGFFASAIKQRFPKLNVRVIDLDAESVSLCQTRGVEAELGDATSPPKHGDETIVCFNLILHHLVGDNEANTRNLQRRALSAWGSWSAVLFINEYIYESWFANAAGRIIYEITSNKLLSRICSAISKIVPSLRANTFGVGVRFRAQDEWIELFKEAGFEVISCHNGIAETVSFPRRLLMIKSIRRNSFMLKSRLYS